jgi:hypothetical protein
VLLGTAILTIIPIVVVQQVRFSDAALADTIADPSIVLDTGRTHGAIDADLSSSSLLWEIDQSP